MPVPAPVTMATLEDEIMAKSSDERRRGESLPTIAGDGQLFAVRRERHCRRENAREASDGACVRVRLCYDANVITRIVASIRDIPHSWPTFFRNATDNRYTASSARAPRG